MMRTELLSSLILDLPPSCIEHSPQDHGYKAQSTLQGLHVSLVFLFDQRRQILQTLHVPFAVLDLRFSPHEPDIFAIATSTGTVHLFSFNPKSDSPLAQTEAFNVAEASTGILVLSLTWAPFSPSLLALTLSDGAIAVLDIKKGTVIFKVAQAHSLEAWVVVWSRRKETTALYTGGDDSAICCHRFKEDSRVDPAPQDPSVDSVMLRDSKIHGAGVTAILPFWVDHNDAEILLTGSYDEYVRVLRVAPGSLRPKVLAETRLNGGVWQLRQLKMRDDSVSPNETGLRFSILASCMHAGCRVLEVCLSAQDDWAVEVVSAFEGHESMNYASDAQTGLSSKELENMTFLSTSFYDKKLCVWRLQDAEPC
ncbi:MAG: hypothetical protein Q9218_000160 [Villophora microphyllina]